MALQMFCQAIEDYRLQPVQYIEYNHMMFLLMLANWVAIHIEMCKRMPLAPILIHLRNIQNINLNMKSIYNRYSLPV